MKVFTVDRDGDLKKFTDYTYPQGSFCFAALLRCGDIKINGARVRKNAPVCTGDVVTYYTTPKQESVSSHTVIYEDENIIAADKVSGVSTEALSCELGAFPAHRLDRNTAGVILFAKNAFALEQLEKAFKQKKVIKKYLAVCADNFASDSAVLKAALLKDEKRSLVKVGREGAEIITEYRVLKRCGGLALCEVILHTGKTHQIRAHLAYVGCPVLGDGKYGDAALNKKYSAARQRLVSKSITLTADGALSYLKGKTFESCQTPEM